MFKSLLSSCLLIVLLFISLSCDTAKDSNTATSTATEESQPVMESEKPAMTGVAMKGDNYEIVILDDSIKSPRKELRGTIDGTNVVVNYGSPSVNGRTLYGDLVPYGKVWRTGANEAAKITISAPLKFGKELTTIPAGTYGLFTMPGDRQNWTIIFNKEADQWGAYDYSDKMDVGRVTTTANDSEIFSERMDFTLSGNNLQLHWGDLVIPIQIENGSK